MATPIPKSSEHAQRRPTRSELAEWMERVALCDLFAAAPPELRRSAGFCVHRCGGVIGFAAPGIDSAWVNRVFTDAAVDAGSAEDVQALLERLRSEGVPAPFVHGYGDPAIERVLGEHGLARYPRDWIKLGRGQAPLPAPKRVAAYAATVRPAALHEAPSFADILARCFDTPPALSPLLAALVQRPRWHACLAFDGSAAVGAGALLVQDRIGYLGFGAVLPEHRGRGIQRALLEKRLRIAFALGCTLVVSETGVAVPGAKNPSEANMLALGLRRLGLRHNYARPGQRFR